MSYKIVWTDEALLTFEYRIDYLKTHWTEREILNFKERTKEYLETLKLSPFIGKRPGRYKNIHMGLILKQVSVIYRINKSGMQIELLSFVDNRQNPNKISRYK